MFGCSASKEVPSPLTPSLLKPLALRHPTPWALVDEASRSVRVFVDRKTTKVFSNVSFGSSGVGVKRQVGDKVTPLGTYHITDIRPSRRFNIFIELSYPSLADAQRGRDRGLISEGQLSAIAQAHRREQLPPQNTSLGGAIGLHGVPAAAPPIQGLIDWTNGCVGLNNRQMQELKSLLSVGSVVEIVEDTTTIGPYY